MNISSKSSQNVREFRRFLAVELHEQGWRVFSPTVNWYGLKMYNLYGKDLLANSCRGIVAR
jgi:hypothetical protein